MLDTLEKIVIVPYSIVKKGPYPQDNPPLNSVRFTSNQVDAIRSGVSKVSYCILCVVIFQLIFCFC